jgi:hypothetical protein
MSHSHEEEDVLYRKQLELYDLLGLKECAMDLEQLFLGLANEIRGLAKDIKGT